MSNMLWPLAPVASMTAPRQEEKPVDTWPDLKIHEINRNSAQERSDDEEN